MNKKNIVLIAVGVLLLIILIVSISSGKSKKQKELDVIPEPEEVFIEEDESLYEKAKEYLINEIKSTGYDKDKEDYQVFAAYQKFGITEQGTKKNVYMWILEKSYYVRNKKPQISEGSSIFYKFIVENDEIVGYETPKDSSQESIQKLAPDQILWDVIVFEMDEAELDDEINEHYDYLFEKESYIY